MTLALEDVYFKLEERLAEIKRFHDGEREFGQYMYDLSLNKNLADNITEIIPIPQVVSLVMGCGSVAHLAMHEMEDIYKNWMKAIETKLGHVPVKVVPFPEDEFIDN